VLQNFKNKQKGTYTTRMSSYHKQNNLYLDTKLIIKKVKLILSHF